MKEMRLYLENFKRAKKKQKIWKQNYGSNEIKLGKARVKH